MGQRMVRRRRCRLLSPGERELVGRLLVEGQRAASVAEEFGISKRTAERIRELAWLRRRRVAGGRRLSFGERELISRGLAAGRSARAIAGELGRAPSTVCREIAAGGGRVRYRAYAAQRRAERCASRPKPTKLEVCPRLWAEVAAGLARRWSPGQISARLKLDYPEDPEMRISHETIYQSLYVQSRGELRRRLSAILRSGRTRRRPHKSQAARKARILEMVSISERPPEVEDRAVPGHWEGDLLMGARNRSAVATLVERHTRYVMLAGLGNDLGTENVIKALKERIGQLPAHLTLSLTWDQGRELSAHRRFSIDTGVGVYFCDPHSPWQRGSNENTNGLLRQYLPKGTDLAAISQAELDRIAAELNGRPRQTLGWMTPAEKMSELLR